MYLTPPAGDAAAGGSGIISDAVQGPYEFALISQFDRTGSVNSRLAHSM